LKQINIRAPLKKYQTIMLQAKEQNLNEADMVLRLVKAFEDVFGYDPLNEVSREANMRDKYVDLLLKIDGVPRLIVEVKAPTVPLRDRQIEQAENYASRNNFQWVLLTNGVEWNLYHLTFGEGIEYERALHVDLGVDDIAKAADMLSILHRDSLAHDGLDEYWACQVALSPASISKALFHEEVLMAVRRYVKKDTGRAMDIEDLAEAIKRMFSQETRELIGPTKIRRAPKIVKREDAPAQPPAIEPPAPERSAPTEPPKDTPPSP